MERKSVYSKKKKKQFKAKMAEAVTWGETRRAGTIVVLGKIKGCRQIQRRVNAPSLGSQLPLFLSCILTLLTVTVS